ncbi:MAG: glycosyltransferase [Gemmatimonadota bacterium]
MRALFLNHNVVRTGTFQRASCLARELVAAGHDITLVTTSRDLRAGGRESEWHGVRIIESPDLFTGVARTGWDPWNTAWRTRRLTAERFDLIHAFDSRPAVILPAVALRRRTGVPLFIDWADWWGRGGTITERSGWAVRTFFSPVETWFEEAFRIEATANTTIVESLRERCIALGVEPGRVIALPNGCVRPAADPPSRAEARRALGIGEHPLVLHLGVMLPADSTFLFDAFRRVREVQPAARLAMVGPYRGNVPADLLHVVQRPGFVEEGALAQWLAAADVGVLVLRDTIASRGRWPGKLSDYLTGGVPIAMTRVGAAAELLGGAGAAALAAPLPEALARTVLGLLDDAAARASMSRAARALATGALSWKAVAERLLEFYAQQRITSGGGRDRALTQHAP